MKTQLSISLFTLLTASLLVHFPATARQVPSNIEDAEFVHFPATARQVPNNIEDTDIEDTEFVHFPATERQVPNNIEDTEFVHFPATARQVPSNIEDTEFVHFPATERQVPNNIEDTEFVRSNCQKIPPHADLCFNLLSRHARKIRQDSANLASVAISVSIATTEKMVDYVSNIGRQADFGADQRTAAAVELCHSSFRDAKDWMRDSITEMRGLGSAGSSESLRFKLSGVQTYMSTALTYEEDCLDAFEDLVDGKIKRRIRDKTQKLEDVTSVALALVNNYVEEVTN